MFREVMQGALLHVQGLVKPRSLAQLKIDVTLSAVILMAVAAFE